MGVIYCLTSPSGKMYIGQTKRPIGKRLREHSKMIPGCVALNSAIERYGFDKFQVEILLEANDSLLDTYERSCIEKYDTICPNGYNIRSGGENSKHCLESCERMRQSKLGDKNPNFGKPRTDSAKQAISKAKSGKNHHFYGKTLTLEHKEALSNSHKKDSDLPMYMVKIKARPEHYTSDGYAVVNHPILKTKYFTSKKLSDADKFALANQYLSSMDAVQRLNGDGSSENTGSKL
jgi:group I intron endonuclease